MPARTVHAKHAPFHCLPVGPAGCALQTMRPGGRARAFGPPAYRGASRRAVPPHAWLAPSVVCPKRPSGPSGASAGGAALSKFPRTGSVDQVGRKSETPLRIASLHFELSTFPGTAPDQLKLPSGAPDPRYRQRGRWERTHAPARDGRRRLAEVGDLRLSAPAAYRDADGA